MRVAALIAAVAVVACACMVSHLRKEIPPPGGCDQCHRLKIAGNWAVAVAPVALGKQGGAPDAADVVLREVRSIPYHVEVPAKRLAIYAAVTEPETVGTAETGIQCFVCHRSPGPPHETLRGKIPHPWGTREGNR